MKIRSTTTIVAGASALALAAAVHAGSVTVDVQGGERTLHAAPMQDLFNAAPAGEFTATELAVVHQSLANAGVTTDGFVTFLLVDSAEGLTFLTLVDDDTVKDGTTTNTTLSMSTTAPSTTGEMLNDVHPVWGDVFTVSDPFGVNTTATGEFVWRDDRGDGFAWTHLENGDAVTFNFELMEGGALESDAPFQYLSYEDGEWKVVELAGFTQNDQFSFSFTVVPVPAAALLGIAGLGGVLALRRRKVA